MHHIDSLFEFLSNSLNNSEKEYLASKLNSDLSLDLKLVKSEPEQIIHSMDKDDYSAPKEEFLTQSKRVIKYQVIKRKLLVQKPKTHQKLENAIKQIGQADGGFSDATVKNIIFELTGDKILIIADNELVNWLK